MAGVSATGASVVVDDHELSLALGRLAKDDRKAVLEAIGAYLVTSTQQRFEAETDPDGRPWKKLARRTALDRIKRGRSGHSNILRDSGHLSNSISYRALSKRVAVGSSVEYAAIHQFGGTIERPARRQPIYQRYNAKTDTLDQRFVRKGRSNFARDVDVKAHKIKIPARPYLGISAADRAEILAIIAGDNAARIAGTAS